MNSSDWKCPACGYLNIALDTMCTSCGLEQGQAPTVTQNRPARRSAWKGRFFGCMLLLLLVGTGVGWLYFTQAGRGLLAGKIPDMQRNAEMQEYEEQLKAQQAGPLGKAAKKRIEQAGQEIERLLKVLQATTDAEVSIEALSQLGQQIRAYTTEYPSLHGFHAAMPRPIETALDQSFSFVLANSQSSLAPAYMDCIAVTVTDWRLEDFRRYEPKLIQLVGMGIGPADNSPYTGSDIERMKQQDEDDARYRQAQEQDEAMHSLACDLLEYGLYPKRFTPRTLVNDPAETELSADLDLSHAREVQPQIKQAAEKSNSVYGHALADRIEAALHDQEIRDTVAGR